MVCNRQKARAGENKESPPRTQPETSICELINTSRTVFTQEQKELFVQQVVQYSQDLEGEDFHYHVLCLNESSTEDYTKKPILNWLFDLTLTRISIHRLLLLLA